MRPLCWITALLAGLTLGVGGCSAPALRLAPVPKPATVAVPVSDTPTAVEQVAALPEVQSLRPELSNRLLVVADQRRASDRCLVVVYTK